MRRGALAQPAIAQPLLSTNTAVPPGWNGKLDLEKQRLNAVFVYLQKRENIVKVTKLARMPNGREN